MSGNDPTAADEARRERRRAKAARDATFGKWLMIVIAPVALFGIGAVIFGDGDGGSDSPGSAASAKYHCEQSVDEKLKSPASSDYDLSASETGTGRWDVSGTVDAENGFGGLVRGYVTCSVSTVDGEIYSVTSTFAE